MASNSPFSRNSTSSLLRSAGSTASVIATYNDNQARDTFNNSLRTSGDLTQYVNYLNGRITQLQSTGSIADQTKALSLNQEVITSTHASASADIQRATIATLDGQGTDTDKLNAIGNAYKTLYSIGDLSAAQSYEQQYYSLSQSIQLKQQTAAASLAASNSSNITEAVANIKNTIENANAAFAAQGPGFLDKTSSDFLKAQGLKTDGVASIFSALAGATGQVQKGVQLNNNTKYAQGTYTPNSLLDVYTQAIALDPSKTTTYQRAIDGYLNGGTGISLPGGGSITYNALMNTVYAGNNGNAPYGVVRGADGNFTVKAENVAGYTWGKDQNGDTKLMPTYSFFTAPLPTGTQNSLKAAGLNVKSDSNGDWWFQATGPASFLSKVVGTGPVQGAVQKNGSVQFLGSDGKLYNMVQDAKGLYGVEQINQYGQVSNNNVAGQYGFTPKDKNIGNTDFLKKTLGGPTQGITLPNGTTAYQANGKIYQLATDSRGLKGLQEIDKTGKVLNANISGQYGFNPNSDKPKQTPGEVRVSSAPSFGFGNAVHNVESLFGLLGNNPSPTQNFSFNTGGLSVDNMVNNAQILQNINSAHNATMLAMAPPLQLPAITLAPAPPPPPTIKINTSPLAGLGTKTVNPQQPTVNPQTPAPVKLQGGGFNLQGGGGGISLQ